MESDPQLQPCLWHVRDGEVQGGTQEGQSTPCHYFGMGQVQAIWKTSYQHVGVTNGLNLWEEQLNIDHMNGMYVRMFDTNAYESINMCICMFTCGPQGY